WHFQRGASCYAPAIADAPHRRQPLAIAAGNPPCASGLPGAIETLAARRTSPRQSRLLAFWTGQPAAPKLSLRSLFFAFNSGIKWLSVCSLVGQFALCVRIKREFVPTGVPQL